LYTRSEKFFDPLRFLRSGSKLCDYILLRVSVRIVLSVCGSQLPFSSFMHLPKMDISAFSLPFL